MKHFATVILAALLVACQPAPSSYTPAPFAFENSTALPYSFNVAKIDFINQYQAPLQRPNAEQDFIVSPAKAVEKWVGSRLRAGGNSGTLQVILHEAKVIETPLNKTKGVKGLFTDDQDARYDGKIAVTFRLYEGASTASRAAGDVEVTRYITINEKATIMDRQRRYHEMLEQMMASFETEANTRFRQYFSGQMR